MRKIAGLIVILVVLILGGYYAMGLATERTLNSNIAMINRSSEIHVDLKEYKRGWFKSHAHLNWLLHIPAQVVSLPNNQTRSIPARDIQIDMPLIVYHGPIIFANRTVKFGLGYAHTVLPLPQEFSREFDNLFAPESTKPKPELSLFINYLNHSKVEFTIPPFKLLDKKEKGQYLDWKGMKSTLGLSGKDIEGEVVISGMQLSDTKVNAEVGKVTMTYDLSKEKNNLYLGDVSIKVPAISVKEADATYFQLKDFAFYNKVNMRESVLDYVLNLSMNEAVVHNKTYGPAHLDLTIKNIDADAAAKLNDLAVQMQQVPDAEKQKVSLAMLSQLPVLFSKGVVFEISRFDVKMPEGLVEGKASVSLPKNPGMNPFSIMQKIKGSAELKVPVAVMKAVLTEVNAKNVQAQQNISQQPAADNAAAVSAPVPQHQSAEMITEEQLKSMLQSGLIVQHDSDYVIQLSFENGHLMVNAKPFNSAMMKF